MTPSSVVARPRARTTPWPGLGPVNMRRITLKVFTHSGEWEPVIFRAPRGQQFSQAGAAHLVSRLMGTVEEKFPGQIFRVVYVGRGQYNVIPEPIAHA